METIWIVVTFAVSMIAVAAAVAIPMYFQTKRQEKHLLAVTDRFLSRNFSEYGMTDLMNKEITADQQQDDDPEADENEAFETYMANRLEAEQALGSGGKVS